jgi:CheY-like chemotaxis protein/HPt (histidine-containing phosphotransfer) domain-containing protein
VTPFSAVEIAADGVAMDQTRPALRDPMPPVLRASREHALRHHRLILVAEDNKTNQKVILQQLRLLGFAADFADDGSEALQRWNSGSYALLLTDLHMPNLDGYELAAAVRAREAAGRRKPIIALTANALQEEADHCRDAGMDDCVSKPVLLASLKATLDRWLPDAASEAGATDTSLAPPRQPLPAIPTVDINVLRKLIGDEPEILREILIDFRVSAARTAIDLRAACAAGKALVAGAAAHKLKSSARTVGASALGDVCADIERAGNAGDHAALAERRPVFDAELAAVDASISLLIVGRSDALLP